MPHLISLTCTGLLILGKTQKGVFPISRLLVNPLKTKIVITQEPVTIWHDTWISNWTWQEKHGQIKKIDDDAMSASLWQTVIFSIYHQFGAIWKLDSRGMVFKTYISINNILLSYKNWKQNLKISNTTLMLLLWKKVIFLPKSANFLQKKNAEISKTKEVLVLKGIFSETTFKCVLSYQNSANSIKF